ncbi:hypothetical protein PENTCL1PPCAC_20541, partial [Pristionchus entomophagus]
EMLHVIYPFGKNITVDSAEFLLKLGGRFQIEYVIERSENFLCCSRDVVSLIEKLRITDTYGLIGLLDIFMNKLYQLYGRNALQMFKDIEESTVFRNLSKKMTDILVTWLLQAV